MFKTVIFRANPGYRAIINDIKHHPDKGRAVVIDSRKGDVDLRTFSDVDVTKIANSGDLHSAVQRGWIIPIEMDEAGANEVFGGQSNAPSAQQQRPSPLLPEPPISMVARPNLEVSAKVVLPEPPVGVKTPVPLNQELPAGAVVPQPDQTLGQKIEEAKGHQYTEIKTKMPLSGEEGTVIIGNPMRPVATRDTPTVMTPETQNKFLRIPGMKREYLPKLSAAGIGHPRDLVRFQPRDLLGIVGLPTNGPKEEDTAIKWTEYGAQALQQSPETTPDMKVK